MCLLEKKTFSAGIQVPYSDFLFYGSPPFRHVNVRKTGLTPCSGRQAGLHCRVAYRTICLPLCFGCFRLIFSRLRRVKGRLSCVAFRVLHCGGPVRSSDEKGRRS